MGGQPIRREDTLVGTGEGELTFRVIRFDINGGGTIGDELRYTSTWNINTNNFVDDATPHVFSPNTAGMKMYTDANGYIVFERKDGEKVGFKINRIKNPVTHSHFQTFQTAGVGIVINAATLQIEFHGFTGVVEYLDYNFIY